MRVCSTVSIYLVRVPRLPLLSQVMLVIDCFIALGVKVVEDVEHIFLL